MTTVMLFFGAMAVIISIIFYVGYRAERKNAWRREEDPAKKKDNTLDPKNL